MSQEKINRRKAAGDVDPTMTSKSNMTLPGAPQPMPGAPQSSANMMNNPQVAESMGGPFAQPGSLSGGPQSPYGDQVFDVDVFSKVGTPGIAPNSERNQSIVAGRGLNADYGSIQQPLRESQDMMEPMHLAQEAAERGEKHYGSADQLPYQVGPLGMMGFDMDMAQEGGFTPVGAIPSTMSGNSEGGLTLQGVPEAQAMSPDNGSMVPGSTKTTIRKGNK